MRALLAGSAALTAGLMAASAGVTVASVSAPAVRPARAAAPPSARGGRTGTRAQPMAALSAAGPSMAGPSMAAAGDAASVAAATAAAAAATTAAETTSPDVRVREGICTVPPAHKALAVRLSADIKDALRGRAGHHAVTVYDTVTKVSCYTDSGRHFDSASIVKAIILAALLRWHQETGRPLSPAEKEEARLMITQSDNEAATDLWDEVGMGRLQHFLDLAKMYQTQLGQDGYWGLTQVTAHDEMLLLELLATPNSVLTASSRSYELGLMAKVIPGQRWGTPAGAPAGITVHVKNGWLPDDTGWHINSVGAFTGKDKDYLIAVLTDDNPSEQYGIDTIERVARLVHRDLNAVSTAATARLAASEAPAVTPSPASTPWAVVPALPSESDSR
ncbi:MAG TPA: serine hydrolase [Trebonia sp.]|nr:serine hydrolase [Trebonia sp.]